jgi:peptidoglycan glycosyltransferase
MKNASWAIALYNLGALYRVGAPRNSRTRSNSTLRSTIRSASHTLSVLLACTLISPSRNHHAHAADSSSSSALQAAPEMLLEDAEVARTITRPQDYAVAFNNDSRIRGRADSSKLDVVDIRNSSDGSLRLANLPNFSSRIGDRFASITPKSNVVFYTLTDLQDYVARTVANAGATHVAVVAMDPKTGAILAIAGKSPTIQNIEYHAGFPAASLFKVVTAAAAVEEVGIDPYTPISFRGGTYTLNQFNYLPNPRSDRRVMSVGEAMGRSCNPVFGQIGIKYLDGSILARYANRFGFNRSLGFEASLDASTAEIPAEDLYELSRTAAGFGEIRISPIHAAAVVSGIANGGLLPKPRIIDRIVTVDGVTLEQTRPEALQRIVQPSTASAVLEMMRYTTTIGTSRREFMPGGQPALGAIDVAGKTGTLSGNNPPGLNNWFIGVAPSRNPEIAVAVITVDATHSSKASRLGRLVMQRFFNIEPQPEIVRSAPRRSYSSYSSSRHTKSRSRGKGSYGSAKKKSSLSKKQSSKAKPKKKRA